MRSEEQSTAPPRAAVGPVVGRSWTRRARHLPADDHDCGWLETLPALEPAKRLERDLGVDCAVVGAGFVGLSAARRLALARPDWTIALIDAQRVGFGASGRCSGFLVDLVDFTSKMKPLARAGYVNTARWGIERLRSLSVEHEFDCEWDDKGWVRGAVGEDGMRFLEAWPGWLDEVGIDYHWLDNRGMQAVTGSELYRAGIRLPGYSLIHPGKLVRSLREILPENVALFEESPVRSVRQVPRGGLQLEVGGPSGLFTLSARRVFLTTNGYLPSQGFHADRVFPCFTFASMTRVLSAEEQANLGGETEWGLLAMDPMGTTIRRTRGQRLLFRNTAHYAPKLSISNGLRAKMRAFHRQALQARYPQLANIEFEHTWGGLMGTSHNSQLLFGETRPGLFTAAAFNAAGIAMGAAAGELLADLAVGRDSEQLRAMRALPAPTWMPPEPFRGWGGRLIIARKNAQAAEYI